MPYFLKHPRLLERAYGKTNTILNKLKPILLRIGFSRTALIFVITESVTKKALFDCRMCGQCVLNSTGMVCPETCPKDIRNGPCGGVLPDGKCELHPQKSCVWVTAWGNAFQMETHGLKICQVLPPVDRSLQGTSAWLNTLQGETYPPYWLK